MKKCFLAVFLFVTLIKGQGLNKDVVSPPKKDDIIKLEATDPQNGIINSYHAGVNYISQNSRNTDNEKIKLKDPKLKITNIVPIKSYKELDSMYIECKILYTENNIKKSKLSKFVKRNSTWEEVDQFERNKINSKSSKGSSNSVLSLNSDSLVNKSVLIPNSVNNYTYINPVTIRTVNTSFIQNSFGQDNTGQEMYSIDCNLTTSKLGKKLFFPSSKLSMGYYCLSLSTSSSDKVAFVLDDVWNRIVYSRANKTDSNVQYYDVKSWGDQPTDILKLVWPQAICVTNAGDIFVVDRGLKKVLKYRYDSVNHNLILTSTLSFVDANYLSIPVDIDYYSNTDGNYLFVADIGRHSIVVFNLADGSFYKEIKTYKINDQSYSILNPQKVLFSPSNVLTYIEGSENKCISGRWVDDHIETFTNIGTDDGENGSIYQFPSDCKLESLGCDAANSIMIADPNKNMVHKLNSSGQYLGSQIIINSFSPIFLQKKPVVKDGLVLDDGIVASVWNYDTGIRRFLPGVDVIKEKYYADSYTCNFQCTFTDRAHYSLKLIKTSDGSVVFNKPDVVTYSGGVTYESVDRNLLSPGQYKWVLSYKPYYNSDYGSYAVEYTKEYIMDVDLFSVNLYSNFPEGQNISGNFIKINGVTSAQISAYKNTNIQLEAILPSNNYIFYKWSDGATDNPRNYTVSSYATINAIFKGIHNSNQISAFSNSNQRKYIRTPDNNLHLVYESMGLVWYERSSDNGSTWQIMNNGKPLSENPAKSPSIDYCGNSTSGFIGIVFQEKSSLNPFIRIKCTSIKYNQGVYTVSSPQEIASVSDIDYSSYDASPVIACGITLPYFTALWKSNSGLVTRFCNGNTSPIQFISGSQILSTISDANADHPFLVNNKISNAVYHLAWEQKTSSSSSVIRYCRLTAGTTFSYTNYSNDISTSAGYQSNTMPTMIPCPDNTVRSSWYGKSDEFGSAVFRGMIGDGIWNSRFWNFGNNVASQCMNLGSDGYYLVWSDDIYWDGNYNNYFTDSRSLSNIYSLSTTGKDVQLNNDAGGTSSKMWAMSFNSQSSNMPYVFTKSTSSIGSYYGLNKISGKDDIISGRGVTVVKDSILYKFMLKDISVDGKHIKYQYVADTIRIDDSGDLNKYLVTEPFTLSDNSKLTYNIMYSVSDSSKSVENFKKDDYIKYKVELLDKDGNILDCFNEFSIKKINERVRNEKNYNINMNGIGNRQVRLRFLINNNFDAQYFMIDKLSKGSSNYLNKSISYENIKYGGDGSVVKIYSLEQNYPNPFNPSTTIKYQIPKSGRVVLKIYNILGQEIKTLINEYKESGKYQVSFNAENFASGTYVYVLKVNDYTQIRKMILLK